MIISELLIVDDYQIKGFDCVINHGGQKIDKEKNRVYL